ncbi:hypothetical protein BDY24DRAFT_198626 [Mrakia frigida]|uniref:Etp1p n=1 Tax=Mrakia frigida TaxID=29902 RepID=UPI003FCC17E8
MDKHSSLATAEDLLLYNPNGNHSTRPPPPPRTLYSIALTLAPPPSTSASSNPPPPAPPAPLSLLDQLQPDKEPLEKPSSSSSNEEGGARFGPVSIDWVDFSTSLPSSSSSPPPPPSNDEDDQAWTPTGPSDLQDSSRPPKDSLILRSGSTSLPSGTVHLYRHAYPSSSSSSSSLASSTSKPSTTTTSTYTTASVTLDHHPPSSSSGTLPASLSTVSTSPLSPSSANNFLPPAASESSLNADGRLAAVLAVPSYFTPADFLAYVGRAEGEMEALRMIRDVSPSRSLVLIRFRSKEAAEDFIGEFDGRLFNSFEPEQCHVVRIKHVLAHFVPPSSPSTSSSSSSAVSTTDTPAPVETSPFPEDQAILEALDGAFELPSCPVCLERLDSEISGLVTVQCDHRFHCQCLARWSDSRCPVCRYSQTATTTSSNPPPGLPHPPTATCSACSTTDSLWICLICGIVGCGRYSDGKHAQRHFESTGHLYALELETQRVWNYAADEYVHRLLLLQNKPGSSYPSSTSDDQIDGGRPSSHSHSTLVELPPSSASTPVQHHPSLPSSNLSTPNRTHQRNSPSGGGGGGGFGQQHSHQQQQQQYPPPSEKLEALSLEYSHLLTSQLSAQRTYFSTLQTSLETRVVELEAALLEAQAQPSSSLPAFSTPLPAQPRPPSSTSSSEVKLLRSRLKTLERDLASERSISSNLLDNLSSSKSTISDLQKELASEVEKRKEGEEQVRDLMFFLEARDKIEGAGGAEGGGTGGEGEEEGGRGRGLLEELQGGTAGVVVPPPLVMKGGGSGGGKKKKGRK